MTTTTAQAGLAMEHHCAIRCNQNIRTNSRSNMSFLSSAEAQAKPWEIGTDRGMFRRGSIVPAEEEGLQDHQTTAHRRKTTNLIRAKVCQTTSLLLVSQKGKHPRKGILEVAMVNPLISWHCWMPIRLLLPRIAVCWRTKDAADDNEPCAPIFWGARCLVSYKEYRVDLFGRVDYGMHS